MSSGGAALVSRSTQKPNNHPTKDDRNNNNNRPRRRNVSKRGGFTATGGRPGNPTAPVKQPHQNQANQPPPHTSAPAQPPRSSEIESHFVGALLTSPESYGYTKLPHPPQQPPKYLLKEQVLFSCDSYIPNEWDAQNQQRLVQLESAHTGDPQTLFEEFQKLRHDERRKMEQYNLVDVENAKKSLSDAIVFRGSCLDMCPTYERVERSFKNQVSKWEKDPQTGKISRQLAVKTFMRPSGQPPSLPSDVRTPETLVRTLNYLINGLLPRLPDSQSFIWDRTRSIRQDFTFQNNYSGPEAIECHEKICRIHILSSHFMAGANDPDYQQQQEIEQFNNSLQTLTHMYDDVRSRGGRCPNEAEFRAYELVSKLRDTELDRNVQKLPLDILNSGIVQRALFLRGLVTAGIGSLQLFGSFFQAILDPSTPFLLACLSEIHFNQIRYTALKTMARAYHSKSKRMPEAQTLAQWLGFDSLEPFITTCKFYDIPVHYDEANVARVEVTSFKQPYKSYQKPPYTQLLDSKIANESFADVVNSGIPNKDLGIVDSKHASLERVARLGLRQGVATTSALTRLWNSTGQTSKGLKELPVEIPKEQPSFSFTSPAQPVVPQLEEPKFEIPKVEAPIITAPKVDGPFGQPQRMSFPAASIPQQPQSVPPVRVQTPPPPPPPKLVDLANFDAAAAEIVSEITQKVVSAEVANIVKYQLQKDQQKREREQRNLLINSLSTDLFTAFMREQMYIASLVVKARIFREKTLKRLFIRKVKAVAKVSSAKVFIKREKINEIDNFANKVRPAFVFPTFHRKFSQTPVITEPVKPVETVNLEKILTLLPTPTKLKMLVIVEDWTTLGSKWLSKKLSLKYTRDLQKSKRLLNKVETAGSVLEISSLPDRFKSRKLFQNINFVLIKMEKVTITKIKDDAKVVAKVIEYLSLYNKETPVTLLLLLIDSSVEESSITTLFSLNEKPSWLSVELINSSKLTPNSIFESKLQNSLVSYEKPHAAQNTLINDSETTLMSKYTTIENSLIDLVKKNSLQRNKINHIRSLMTPQKRTFSSDSAADVSLLSVSNPPVFSRPFEFAKPPGNPKKQRKIEELLKLTESVLKQ